MARLSKLCVFRLSQNHFYLIANDASIVDGATVVWCQMEQEHFFTEYILEGVTEADPDIYLELQPSQMAQTLTTLKSSQSTKSVKIKLTRKHEQACLSFAIEMPSNRQCVHDIPVKPIPRRDWADFAEPTYDIVPENFVSLTLPCVKKLKHIVERYRNLGPYVKFEASQKGTLEMALISDKVKLSTHFKDLQVVRNQSATDDDNEEEDANPIT